MSTTLYPPQSRVKSLGLHKAAEQWGLDQATELFYHDGVTANQ